MPVWRYKAIALEGGGTVHRGEQAGDSAAEVRAALRRAGLQVIFLRPLDSPSSAASWWSRIAGPVRVAVAHHLRARRRERVADLLDGLATMLASGLPMLEAIDSIEGARSRRSALRAMLVQVREGLRGGETLAGVLERQGGWFDRVDVAMIRAGEHSGELPGVLRTLASRHAHSGELTQRLIGALAYPAIVACVGVGVVIFLSTRTLPDLVGILDDANIATPRLTSLVMTLGQIIAKYGLLAIPLVAVASGVGLFSTYLVHERGCRLFRTLERCTPETMRRMALARAVYGLAELLRVGVPAVEALRLVGPTVAGPASDGLRRAFDSAAKRIEHGDSFAAALDDPRHFDAEFRRLVAIGEASGALDELLRRIAERYERRARRLIDRSASLLEPAVILLLAVLVGVVVMAAVLPLLRLQEVIG